MRGQFRKQLRLISGGVGLLMIGSVLPVQAIPDSQEQCVFNVINITAAMGFQSLGLAVTINNGNVPRKAIVQLSADMGVDPNAEVRIAYSIDGGAPQEHVFGPGNLANHQEFWETRTTMAVIPLPAGTHSIAAFWRISGSPAKSGFAGSRCMTVEGRTR